VSRDLKLYLENIERACEKAGGFSGLRRARLLAVDD
jgi:hypothetical protein